MICSSIVPLPKKKEKKTFKVIFTVCNCLLRHTLIPFLSADIVPAKQEADLPIKLYRQRQINSEKLKGKM